MLRKRYPQSNCEDFKASFCPNCQKYHPVVSNMPRVSRYHRFQQLFGSVPNPPQPTVKTLTPKGFIASRSNIKPNIYSSVKSNKVLFKLNHSTNPKNYAIALENKIYNQMTKKLYKSGKNGGTNYQKSGRSQSFKNKKWDYQRNLDILHERVIRIPQKQENNTWKQTYVQQDKIFEQRIQDVYDSRIQNAKGIHYKNTINEQKDTLAQKIKDLKQRNEALKYQTLSERSCEQQSRAQTVQKQLLIEGRETRITMQIEDQQIFRSARTDFMLNSKVSKYEKQGIAVLDQQKGRNSNKSMAQQSQKKLMHLKRNFLKDQYFSVNDNRCLGFQVCDQGQILYENS